MSEYCCCCCGDDVDDDSVSCEDCGCVVGECCREPVEDADGEAGYVCLSCAEVRAEIDGVS